LPADAADRVLQQAVSDLDRLLTTRIASLENWDQADDAVKRSFKRWFGSADAAARKVVLERLEKVQQKLRSMTLDNFAAAAPQDEDGEDFAFVREDDDTKVYLTERFRHAATLGRDSRPGVLAHEISHYRSTGRTRDWAYGEARCEDMARSHPHRALENADSFEYFVEGGLS
jgi:hypothetical protein